jgi:hypothetical protein
MLRCLRLVTRTGLVLAGCASILWCQPGTTEQDRLPTWFPYQLIPNLIVHTSAAGSIPGIELEAAPLLYSWGINRHISPWYSFIVVPPARFSGSIEWNVGVQAYASKVGRSHVGLSTHLMGYFPLSDVGELAGLNLGLGTVGAPDGVRFSKVVGLSTAFGMLHLNVKHLDRPTAWVTSLEARIY